MKAALRSINNIDNSNTNTNANTGTFQSNNGSNVVTGANSGNGNGSNGNGNGNGGNRFQKTLADLPDFALTYVGLREIVEVKSAGGQQVRAYYNPYLLIISCFI
jgi:hypothetical protein